MRTIDVTPSASRLTGSLRDIGYDLNTAVADLIDNSIAADAMTVDVELRFDGLRSQISIADDGVGMTPSVLDEALRFGSRREYERNELGRYGLGLKTASIAHGRAVSVVTRAARTNRVLHGRCLDLDHIEDTDRWEVIRLTGRQSEAAADGWLDEGTGTVVVISKLDRLLPERNPEGGWARRRFDGYAQKLREHLGMTFHRFLEPSAQVPLTITVNGEKAHPWNPFAPDEERVQELPAKVLRLETPHGETGVRFRPYVLPSRRGFSSAEEFERLSGPSKWNKQQGFYIYRADRLIQSGGWSGMRAADEHTKLARAALEFDTEADDIFRINVAKMRVNLPAELRTMLARPVQELCNAANATYREDARVAARPSDAGMAGDAGRLIGTALMSAAAATGDIPAIMRVLERLTGERKDVVEALGL